MKKAIKKILLALITFLICTAFFTGCAPTEWKTYVSNDGSISFDYLSPNDVISAIDEMEIYGVYRKNAFTVSISIQGTSRDLDTMGKSLAKYYTNDKVTVDQNYIETSVGNRSCRMLPLSGEDVAEGGVFYFRNEKTDVFYTVYYSVSKKAGEDVISHVHTILDSIRF